MAVQVSTNLRSTIAKQRYVTASASQWELSTDEQESFAALQSCWNNLEFDKYYGGTQLSNYRVRRYSDFDYVPTVGELRPHNHLAYYQSKYQNSYAGDQNRHFGDVLPETYENKFFQALVEYDFKQFPVPEKYLNHNWICHIHMIRIVVGSNQTTSVTPEGIHSDGYPFAAVHLMTKKDIAGGESRVYTLDGDQLASLTFEKPLDSLWFEDRFMKHYVTPISNKEEVEAHRDILAISFSLPDSPYITDV
ncbi:MAG: 2OG-Fe dioxygenase family protein [Symploca sp. SIO2B6]|nr:2OG-Fe dioxygenase family protein [Symploca sp. SIO2B6]